jgi:hypothetical protein
MRRECTLSTSKLACQLQYLAFSYDSMFMHIYMDSSNCERYAPERTPYGMKGILVPTLFRYEV